MQLLHLDDCPSDDVSTVYRESPIPSVIAFVVIFGVTAALAGSILVKGMPWPVWIPVVFFGLFSVWMFKLARAGFRPTNWLVRETPSALYLKFRTHLNDHFPAEDKTVVRVDVDEIESARECVEKRVVPDGRHGSLEQTWRFLDLRLRHRATDEVAEAIRRERGEMHEGTRYNHYPVQVPEPGLIRLTFGSRQSHVKPGLAAALQSFARVMNVADPLDQSLRWQDVPDEELPAFLLELDRTGSSIDAKKILRLRCDMDVDRARAYLAELRARESEITGHAA